MICPNCQTPNRASARYCDSCGYELPSLDPLRRPSAPSDPFDDDDLLAEPSIDQARIPTADLPAAPAASPALSIYGGSVQLPVMEGPDDEEGGEGGDAGLPVIGAGDDGIAHALTQPLDDMPEAALPGSSALIAESPRAPRTAREYRVADDAPPKRSPRLNMPRKRIAIIAGAIALACALILSITFGAQLLGGTTVPDVTGMSQVDGTYMVQEAGFHVNVEEVVSDEVEGIVLSTEPAAGSRLAEGATVTLRISRARTIPDVVGMPLDQAQALIAENGFTNLQVTRKKSDDAADSVLSVTPAPLTTARADVPITIEVAEPFRVPDVAGKPQEEAVALLEAEGYKAGIHRLNTEDAPEGSAVKTEPAAGSVLASGSEVALYLAHNRSAELKELTRGFFEGSPTITIDGQPYEMSKVDDVSYEGGNSCAFAITVRPIQTVTWFGTQTETRYGNYQVVNGTITWTEDNRVSAIDPAIKQGG